MVNTVLSLLVSRPCRSSAGYDRTLKAQLISFKAGPATIILAIAVTDERNRIHLKHTGLCGTSERHKRFSRAYSAMILGAMIFPLSSELRAESHRSSPSFPLLSCHSSVHHLRSSSLPTLIRLVKSRGQLEWQRFCCPAGYLLRQSGRDVRESLLPMNRVPIHRILHLLSVEIAYSSSDLL